ncbi:hypothetical protein BWI92_22525 [Flectobacillus sp. BAB-3569]|nr:hypothetical protein BWI92_22525 [Flectobacillus sp. BAB-3569]
MNTNLSIHAMRINRSKLMILIEVLSTAVGGIAILYALFFHKIKEHTKGSQNTSLVRDLVSDWRLFQFINCLKNKSKTKS